MVTKIQIFFNSFHSKPEILSGGISQDKNLSKHPIILGTGLKMTVISTDFPQNLSDHMPEKSDPIAHNGKQNVLVYHTQQNLLKFLQGVLSLIRTGGNNFDLLAKTLCKLLKFLTVFCYIGHFTPLPTT